MVDLEAPQEATPDKEALQVRLGRNIATRRKALALTQADLAERLSIDTETLSRFERGKHAPSLLTLERIASELLVSCADLLDEAPAFATSDALEIEALLTGLGPSDIAFIRRSLKALRDHLLARSTAT
ncbi:helix-turn-helix domain-containing protein [Roseateles sp. 22389]|uniref:helix-turn-helix domain-containing protein n=1 Tax=Roseateles sp. 22389 TaxID=3453916 RepID=UPI003F849C79